MKLEMKLDEGRVEVKSSHGDGEAERQWPGLWTVDSEWTVDSGLWTVDCGGGEVATARAPGPCVPSWQPWRSLQVLHGTADRPLFLLLLSSHIPHHQTRSLSLPPLPNLDLVQHCKHDTRRHSTTTRHQLHHHYHHHHHHLNPTASVLSPMRHSPQCRPSHESLAPLSPTSSCRSFLRLCQSATNTFKS